MINRAANRILTTRIPLSNVFEEDFDNTLNDAYEAIRAGKIQLDKMSKLDDILSSSSPSDYIVFTKETKRILNDYYHNLLKLDHDAITDTINDSIPNDIFVAGTVPLPDVVFRMTVYNEEYTRVTSEFYIRFLYTGTDFIIAVSNTGEGQSCGAVRVIQDSESYKIDDSIVYVDNPNDPKYTKQPIYRNALKLITTAMASHFLAEWYSLQIMMLNPVIRERLFTRNGKEKLRCKDSAVVGSDNTSKKNKRRAKYIRYKELSEVVLTSDVVRKQHTMCWYVIGHYRHYSSGKKTWVNGYWKGPLRELQKNLDEGRERLLK